MANDVILTAPETAAPRSKSSVLLAWFTLPFKDKRSIAEILTRAFKVMFGVFATVAVGAMMYVDVQLMVGLIQETTFSLLVPLPFFAWTFVFGSAAPLLPNFSRIICKVLPYESTCAYPVKRIPTGFNWHELTPVAIWSHVVTLYMKASGWLLLVLTVLTVVASFLPPSLGLRR